MRVELCLHLVGLPISTICLFAFRSVCGSNAFLTYLRGEASKAHRGTWVVGQGRADCEVMEREKAHHEGGRRGQDEAMADGQPVIHKVPRTCKLS